MDYLEKIGFSSEDINVIKKTTTKVIFNLISEQKKLVNANITYLKKLGVTNYKEIFIKYPDLFLIDNSNFKDIFEKYDTEDLINKLKDNIEVFAYL